MASHKSVQLDGRTYNLFEKSIQVEGIAKFVFFTRPVNMADVILLHSIYELGRKNGKNEVADVIKNILGM
jgi:hypothetical protein